MYGFSFAKHDKTPVIIYKTANIPDLPATDLMHFGFAWFCLLWDHCPNNEIKIVKLVQKFSVAVNLKVRFIYFREKSFEKIDFVKKLDFQYKTLWIWWKKFNELEEQILIGRLTF